ncbi:hypothetical protein P3T73_14395 [Kiritimatiellota bacterium B12222]|nr:hypothetical protein P3T73_14395 [Kiritimatiellota bacterium B12222]
MSCLDKLEHKFGRFTFPYLLLVLLGGQVLAYILVNTQPDMGEASELGLLEDLVLIPHLVLQGDIWRMFTFMFLPNNSGPLFFGLFIWISYMMGSALEREWGEFRFSIYLGSAWLSTLLLSFLNPGGTYGNYFIFGSLVIAFAKVFPHYIIRLFFVLPVPVKYIGYLTWGVFALEAFDGSMSIRLSVLGAVVPFFLFFGKEVLGSLKQKKRSSTFKREARVLDGIPFHTCSVCKRTDKTNPELGFRYEGEVCICETCLQERNAS